MSSPFACDPFAAATPFPTQDPTPDLAAIAMALASLLEAEPHGSPVRYPLRVALQFARLAAEVANQAEGPPEATWADFNPEAAHLPGFGKIATLLGPALTVCLIERFGNCRLYIPTPERLHEGHALVMAIGYEGAMELAQEYSGSSVKVPSGHWTLLHARNAKIAERYHHGEAAAKLAREYFMAEDSVYRIANRAKAGEVAPLAYPERFETLDLFAEGVAR